MKKLKKIQKSNDLNQTNFSEFSLSTYRVMLNLISKIQKKDINNNLLPINLVSRECVVCAKEFAKEFPSVGNHAYKILEEAVDKLLKTTFLVKTSDGIKKINVCSQAYYKEKEGKIEIEFTDRIMPHLAALSNNFTIYNLKEISDFNSIYTIRLYELLMQFSGTGQYITTVNNLRSLLGCINTLARYVDFKRRTFEHAVIEINKLHNMELSFEEIKENRKVVKLVFTFKKSENKLVKSKCI